MSTNTTRMQTFLKGLLLGSYAWIIFYLTESGQLNLYIAPRMTLLVKLACLVLYVFAALLMIVAFLQRSPGHGTHDHAHDPDQLNCGCQHDHDHADTSSRWGVKRLIVLFLFLVPIGLIFLTPSSQMDSALALKKGIQYQGKTNGLAAEISEKSLSETETIDDTVDPNETNSEPAPAGTDSTTIPPADTDKYEAEENSIPSFEQAEPEYAAYAKYARTLYEQPVIQIEPESYLEALTVLDMFKEDFIGKPLVISGFILREEIFTPDQMAVARFAVQCCSADSTPFGILVEGPRTSRWETDEWVEVEGTLSTTTLNEVEILSLQSTAIRKITAPEDPYVYVNTEMGF
ncbi:TIGR03943 family putative permease subunit [Marinicrinis sediminis]|uniref:TIGR03943 family putative permease subunit n=1 Tax=Marinicrinis sediminis TaxID=1652465 RepID=A0ABW5RDA2_9BACL